MTKARHSSKRRQPDRKGDHGQIQCPSREKREARLLEKGEGLPLLARSMLKRHKVGLVEERRGCHWAGWVLIAGQVVLAVFRVGQGACRAGRVPLFAWQAGGVRGAVGRKVGGAAGCRQTSGLGGCHWAGGVACRKVGGAAGCRQTSGLGGATGCRQEVWGCHWAGGAAGCRQEVWGVPLGRGCCWSQARGVGGATGQGVLLYVFTWPNPSLIYSCLML